MNEPYATTPSSTGNHGRPRTGSFDFPTLQRNSNPLLCIGITPVDGTRLPVHAVLHQSVSACMYC